MKGGMNASRLRSILAVTVIVIAIGIAGGFWFAHRNLNAYATQISTMNADAKSGDTNIQTLLNVQKRLEQEQTTIANARSIVADSATFSDLVVNDISRIANESGVSITGFEFVESAGTGTAAPATVAPPATPGASAPTAAIPGGVSKRVVSVSLESPLRYASLMEFIRKIETNDLKMQFASVSMTKDEGANVATQTFSIEVYVRS